MGAFYKLKGIGTRKSSTKEKILSNKVTFLGGNTEIYHVDYLTRVDQEITDGTVLNSTPGRHQSYN